MSMESAAALNVNWPNPNPRGFRGFGRFGGQQERRRRLEARGRGATQGQQPDAYCILLSGSIGLYMLPEGAPGFDVLGMQDDLVQLEDIAERYLMRFRQMSALVEDDHTVVKQASR
mgnify:CR=1 FL=1